MGTGHACRACFAVAAYAATTCLWLAGVKVFPAGGRLTSLERALPGTLWTQQRCTAALGHTNPTARRSPALPYAPGRLGDVQRSLAFRRARFLTSRSH